MSSSASPSTVQPSQCARPPTREEIATFMLRNTAHLPLVHQTEEVRQGREAYAAATAAGHQHTNSLRWLPPYLYTGADYALVLSACFPNKCIDLSLLNWSANPLFSQRQGNLHVFCQSARSLALPDAPLSALHPERLQNCAACIVEHLKVQHWLYSLSLRFMPASDHDAAALRVVHRHLQSGEPYLHQRQSEHDEVGVCVSVRDCPPLPADHVLRCAPALTPIPVATDAHHHSPLSSSAAGASAVSQPKGGGAETPTMCSSPSAGDAADSAQRQKPWLNYSKPWLLPSLRAAEAKKAASEAAAAKRAQEERERNSRYTAFVAESRNVYEQYVLSCAAVSEKREQLRVIKELVHQEVLEGKTLDFKDYAARIRDCNRRWRVYVQRDSFVGASERCASAAALACVCRFLHDPHSHQQEDGPTATSSRTTKLRRAMWMRMHPVERWTSLVDLGRRGAYLIEKPLDLSSSDAREMACKSTPIFCDSRGVASVLGGTDPQVHFTAESTESHCQLCRALPYAARLHLCLSLLLWIRCLRDVQDTLARTRLPFASVRRLQKYAVADVFPTRLSEYWVDAHTTVSTRMNPLLNPTAEQIPAPHTWDAETSETIEDAATESTVTLDAGRVLHGRHQARLSRGVQLQQVQGILPRASADDEMPARLTGLGYAGGDRSRRRRRWMKKSVSLHPDVLAGELSPTFSTRLESLEFACDTSRRVPPVSLEPEPLEDARYHGNYNRGEGCPLREGGTASPVPIFIHVPPEGFRRAGDPGGAPPTQVEFLVRYCVMAHAAVLSSLFIEGRVVDVSSNHPLVIAYVRWLLEEFMVKQFVSVSLLTEDEVASYRPYFPPWCWRSVLVLMPPRDFKGYSVAVLRDWAARIVQAAPCTVLVEGHVTAGWYVRQLQDEVRLLQDAFDTQSVGAVEWMTVGPTAAVDAPTREGGADKTEGAVNNHSSRDGKGGPEVSHFQPQRCPKAACFSSMSVCEVMLASARSLGDWLMPEDLNMTAKNTSRHTVFLEAVRETLENRFYTCELLYSPAQSCLSPYCFERWVLERLPKNVRVVGINTSPLDVLYFFPQGVFLTQKVGNAFRYRAVDRTVVAKDLVPSWGSHPLRYASTQLKRLSRRWRRRGHDVAGGLHAEFSPTDISALQRAVRALSSSAPSCHPAPRHGAKGTTLKMAAEENASNALVRERMVEYLAEPSKGTLLGLAVARFLRV